MGACFRLVSAGVPKTFPKLRFGFIETAASWIPWVVYELRRRMDTVEDKLPEELLKEYNLYVTCQIGDDVPYLMRQAGEGALMIGTDYGHADSSTELEALTSLKEDGGISEAMHTRIVEDNPRQFYGL